MGNNLREITIDTRTGAVVLDREYSVRDHGPVVQRQGLPANWSPGKPRPDALHRQTNNVVEWGLRKAEHDHLQSGKRGGTMVAGWIALCFALTGMVAGCAAALTYASGHAERSIGLCVFAVVLWMVALLTYSLTETELQS